MNRELTDAVTAVAGARAGSAMAGISTLLSNSWIDSKDELLEVYSNRDSGDAWKQLLNDAKDLDPPVPAALFERLVHYFGGAVSASSANIPPSATKAADPPPAQPPKIKLHPPAAKVPWPVSSSEQLGNDRSGQLRFRMETHYHVYQFHHGMTKDARNKIVDKRWRLSKFLKDAKHKVIMRGGIETDLKKLSGELCDYDGGGGGAKPFGLESRLESALNRARAQIVDVNAHIEVLKHELERYKASRPYQQLTFSTPAGSSSSLIGWDEYKNGAKVSVNYGKRGNGVDTVYIGILSRQREGATEHEENLQGMLRKLRGWQTEHFPEDDDDALLIITGGTDGTGGGGDASGGVEPADPFASSEVVVDEDDDAPLFEDDDDFDSKGSYEFDDDDAAGDDSRDDGANDGADNGVAAAPADDGAVAAVAAVPAKRSASDDAGAAPQPPAKRAALAEQMASKQAEITALREGLARKQAEAAVRSNNGGM